MNVAITSAGVLIDRSAVVSSTDGARRAPLQTVLHSSWTPAERAEFDVYYVEIAPPDGQRWTGAFTGTSPEYEPVPPPTPEQIERQAVGFAQQLADELVRQAVVGPLLDTVSDEQLAQLTYLYDEWSGDGAVLKAEDKVRRNGVLYRVIIGHTTQPGWPPETEEALFTKFRDPVAGPQPWVAPTGAQDAYAIGEEVTHPTVEGVLSLWRSKINANTTEPDRDGDFHRWWEPLGPV